MSAPQPSYEEVHAKRFALSMEWLRPLLTGKPRLLECGGVSAFTEQLRAQWVPVDGTKGDLRYGTGGTEGTYDGVLCMEVLEHIADQEPAGISAEWQGDGARALLGSIFRSLKPGGWLFLTTPNAASITTIKHALRLAPPQLYRPHVREYAPYELDELVRAAGFAIERRETLDVWRNAISPEEHRAIIAFIARSGYPKELRGEDIFLLARKTMASRS